MADYSYRQHIFVYKISSLIIDICELGNRSQMSKQYRRHSFNYCNIIKLSG